MNYRMILISVTLSDP